ncbi:unnamed protein product, partial [Allacma fusca]
MILHVLSLKVLTLIHSQAGVNDNAIMGKGGIVILLSILIVCIPSAFSGLISPVVKRQLSSPYEVLVAEAATKFPNERFESDPILLQVVENSQSFYRNLENLETVFHRQQDDFGKEVIVLSESEDHVFRAADDIKRVFVVLRRKHGNLYHVAYAYIRKAASSNEPTESNPTGNDFIRIEWDSWSDTSAQSKLFRAFGPASCTSSVFVPCGHKSRSNLLEFENNDIETISSTNIKFQSPTTTSKFLKQSLYNSDTSVFFGDLDDTLLQAHLVGHSMNLITNGMTLLEQIRPSGLLDAVPTTLSKIVSQAFSSSKSDLDEFTTGIEVTVSTAVAIFLAGAAQIGGLIVGDNDFSVQKKITLLPSTPQDLELKAQLGLEFLQGLLQGSETDGQETSNPANLFKSQLFQDLQRPGHISKLFMGSAAFEQFVQIADVIGGQGGPTSAFRTIQIAGGCKEGLRKLVSAIGGLPGLLGEFDATQE